MEDRKRWAPALPPIHRAKPGGAGMDARHCEFLLESVSDAVVAVGHGFAVQGWNPAAERMYGWTAAEAAGKNLLALLGAEFPGSSCKERLSQLFRSGRLEFDMANTTRGGARIKSRANAALMRDGAGRICGCAVVMRKAAGGDARSMAALEADLAAIRRLHGISTMFVREEDLKALLEEIVQAAMEFTGADMCALLAADKRSESLRIVAREGLSQKIAESIERLHSRDVVYAKVMALGGRMSIEDAGCKPAVMCDKGQEAMAALGIRAMQGTQLTSRSGRMLGLLITFFASPHISTESELRMLDMLARLAADIMERSQAEAELQRSNRNTELLYEVVEKLLIGEQTQSTAQEICEKVMAFLDCGLFFNYLFTPDRARLRLNACAGLAPEQAAAFEWLERGQAVCGCVADEGCRIVVEYLQKSRDKRAEMLKPMGVRAYACHPLVVKGEVLGTLAFGTREKDTFSQEDLALMRAVCGHVAVAMNRLRYEADLKKLSEELRDKNRLVTDFFTNISHEFKTPLSIILVDLQLMEYRLKGIEGELREKLGRSVSVMRQNALRLLRLIGNLLDVTKIDAGFMSARFSEADAVEAVRGIAESVGDYARDAGLEVRFESDLASRRMPLDVEKLERILLNLLSNAIKHTPSGGHIFVSLKNASDRITLSVKDDGEGIPEDRREIIFDRFRQVNTSLTRASEGCGIGLSLVKALVELLLGRIWLNSAVGRGSEFFVELPVQALETAAQPMEIDSMPRSRKVEMEFSDIHRINA